MSIGWLTKIADSAIPVTAYATAVDRIGRHHPGEITYLEDVARYEYWDGAAWQPLGGGGGGVTPPVVIAGTDPATVPLTVTEAPGQTAKAFEVHDSAGARLINLGATGGAPQISVGPAYIYSSAGNYTEINSGPNEALVFTSVKSTQFNSRFVVQNGVAGQTTVLIMEVANQTGSTFQIVGGSAQTGPLVQILDANYATRFRVTADGGVSVGGAPSMGGGAGPMLFVANDASDPSTNPVGGGVLFVSNGALKYRGSSGTVTTIAPA